MSERASRSSSAAAALLAGYQPLRAIPDELLDFSGQMRPGWSRLIDHLASRTPEELERQFARGANYLRDAGVYFRQYGQGDMGLRDWPLSPVPVVVSMEEWPAISQGLIERADLLEMVLADIYGDNTLVRDGHLPASLVAGNPEWLRPMVGTKPASGHYLHFVAFDIGRGPDGRWWVLGDRTQAPSGAGYALENRVASAHSFAGFYRDAHVLRVANFFRAFRESLNGMRQEDESRVAVLTPGPLNDTYFEHAYIARYLGLMLLEGEDLAVEDGRLFVRTVAGLKPVSVLWRRLDATWADPMELDENSHLGTPGLLSALRAGRVSMINALGSGALESRAFLAFMPRLSRILAGRPLSIPNIATWWCGAEAERAHVLAKADRMIVGHAHANLMPVEPVRSGVNAADAATSGADLAAWLDADGGNLVGQERVTLSTTPVWHEGRLVPRPMSIRLFLARTQNGWQVMPGGYARIAAEQDPSAVSIARGGSVADVWVVSDKPVPESTLIEQTPGHFSRSASSVLPSRAADNLFWLGRYVERAEGMMRLLRAYNSRLDESPAGGSPLLEAVNRYLDFRDVKAAKGIPPALVAVLGAAVGSAGRIRDRFSVDAWSSLADLERTVGRLAETVVPGDDAALAMGVLLRKIAGFAGLVHDNMYRFAGWRFLTLGRSVERALEMTSILTNFAVGDAPEGGLDLCIEVGDSVMTHRRRYSVTTTRETVLDLLALDQMNPRAIAYHVDEIRNQASLLPNAEVNGQLSTLSRRALKLYADLAVHTPDTLGPEELHDFSTSLYALTGDLADAYFR